MAILLPGAPGGELRGKLGGVVYSRNSSGPYVRSMAVPTNPNTSRQQSVRNDFALCAAAWTNTLTTSQRASWIEYAAQVSWVNSLGIETRLSGFNHFVRLNALKLQAGQVMQTSAPAVAVLPSGLLGLTVDATIGPETLSIAFTTGQAVLAEVGGFIMVYATDDVPPSRKFIKPVYRYVGKIAGAATPPTSPQTLTVPMWAWQSDSKCLVAIRVLRLTAGVTEPQLVECLVTS